MYKTIKKFLAEGGKCLLIENGEPVGVVLNVEEYELLQSKSQIPNSPPARDLPKGDKPQINPEKEMDFPEASAEIADIEAVDDVTLKDLGIDELPY